MKHKSKKHSKKHVSKSKTIEYTLNLNTEQAKKKLVGIEKQLIRLQVKANRLRLAILKLTWGASR